MNAVHTHEERDRGFTLIELLIVIVILGVLAAVVVFAVAGIRDRGDEAAEGADERTLVTAEESHRAIHGVYASEADLVSAGLLRDESTLLDIDVAGDLSSYTIGAAGSFTPIGGGPPSEQHVPSYPTPGGTSYEATVIDQGGTRLLVIIGSGAETPGLWSLLSDTPPTDTNIVWFNSGDVETTADVEAIWALHADYVIAPFSIQIQRSDGSGSTFVGTYLNETRSSPGDFWWTHQQGGNPTLEQIEARLG